MTVLWPLAAAQERAVRPFASLNCRSTFCCASNRLTILSWPLLEARIRGVEPFAAVTSAPFSTRSLTTSMWPLFAAEFSGVHP
ncbi:hypothetical protein F5Y08DRAFT_322880 [Xylaria arbuscula]|nr:hypothetical protein F5Y08DRAFT_322880 [Xylaria arbuscula]